MLGGLLDDEAALVGVGGERDVGLCGGTGRGVEMEEEIVCESGGKDERGAFDGDGGRGFEEAGDVVGFCGAQGGSDGLLDGGQADDDDGFGVDEGGWGVEAEVEGLSLWKSDGGDVLVLGGVEVAHEADEIDQGADVGGVSTAGGELGGAGGVDEVRAGAGRESGDEGLLVAVVEEGLGAGLGEAGELGIDGLLEAVGVGFEGEGAGEEVGVLLEVGGVRGRDAADEGEVFFDAGLLEAGLGEVLRGADEDAGTATDGGAEGGEVRLCARRTRV